MTSTAELNDIALTFIQATGLLLPVIFLTLNFVRKEGFDTLDERTKERLAEIFAVMTFSLTATGLFATIGLLNSEFKNQILFFAVAFLTMFFGLYGYFMYKLVFN